MNETETSNGGASTIKIAFGENSLQHAATRPDRGVEQACRFLDELLQLKASVGDGLNDQEFTRLAFATLPDPAAEFSFISFSNSFVTFAVPPQRTEAWCATHRWIAEEKEELARQIGAEFGLMVCEPPDQLSYIISPRDAHHHLEFASLTETMAVAHPKYLKLRLFSQTTKCSSRAREGLPPVIPFFRGLARLYAG